MISLLKEAVKFNLFNSLDIQLAIRLVKDQNPLLLLIIALLSAKTRAGHICLFIDKLQLHSLFDGRCAEIAFMIWKMAGFPNIDNIYATLVQSNIVCNANQTVNAPLVLFDNKLYFQRKWSEEGLVANFFSQNLLENVNEQYLSTILTYLFTPSNIKDWQKIAVAVAVTSRISIISGGPGTGKTTIIALLLLTLIKLSNRRLIIQLAAPTGRAASRLMESLNNTLFKLNLSASEQANIPKQAETIHRLLGARSDSKLLRYNKENQLLLDTLIIDEASMIDLSLMAKLIEAVPNYTRIIFLGDKDQLASVEAGAIFSDLCCASKYGYSRKRVDILTKITNFDLSDFISDDGPKIKDRICLLRKNYRFHEDSIIGKFAAAINQTNLIEIEKLLSQQNENISFHSISTVEEYNKLLYEAMKYYCFYLDKIKTQCDPEEIITSFNLYRLLAALREGPYGVVWLNNRLEKFLYYHGYIQPSFYDCSINYEGRPIMVIKNDYHLGLFNGDTGILLQDGRDGLKAFFQLPNGVIKKIQLSLLPQHETAFVITVHKAQGSEFKHVGLVLPTNFTPVLNKELVYTAVTRAKNKIAIYADYCIFIKTLMISTKRYSGLFERLF